MIIWKLCDNYHAANTIHLEQMANIQNQNKLYVIINYVIFIYNELL